ncbi:MAG: 4-hydroxyphenylacetate 3-hydroxylase family protein [Acidimicrobiales bacterium]
MGLRTGQEYLAGLKDDRHVYHDGRRITDPTTEPGLRNTALTVAQYYDMQTNPDLEDLLTYETPDGDRAHLSFIEPKSVDDLRRRAGAFAAWSEVTAGLMGRAPDYMNACMMAIGNTGHVWGRKDERFAKNAYDIYLRCRRNDVCMTHTFVNPMTDRFTPMAEQEQFVNAGIVDQNDDGIFVTGARMVGTLAPFADENLSFGAPLGLMDPREDIYALGFQCKVDNPNLKWICRDKLDPERPHYDMPLATRFEEMDAIAIWENAFIPWEDVFIAKDLDAHNESLPGVKFFQSLGHHVIVKNVAKTRFLFGLAHLLAESSQVSVYPNVQDRLGDILMWLHTMEALAIAAVEGAELNPENGLYYANEQAIQAALRLYPEVYPRIVDHLYQLGGGGYVSIPQEATMEMADLAIGRYYKGATVEAKDKVALFRLAWDVVGSGWGGRQELYERFFFGDTQRMKGINYQFYDKDEATAMVARILTPPSEQERLAWPERFRPATMQAVAD